VPSDPAGLDANANCGRWVSPGFVAVVLSLVVGTALGTAVAGFKPIVTKQ